MPSTDQVASVYADALLELAIHEGGNSRAQELGDELGELCEVIIANKAVVRFLSSPVVDRAERSAVIERTFKGRISDTLYRFVLTVDRNGRLGHLVAMEQCYDALLQKLFGKTEVDVYTVDGKSLDASTEELLRERVKATAGEDAVFHYYADGSMIGGIKLQIGDQLVDGSIATRLRRLQAAIVESGGASVRRDPTRFIG
ncbi:MAG: ATP synthase F1 subunit delta [Phycisphaerales bacterium]|nr:ATP synthase F1 subunit delta [Phycisphaerales bacterium]